MAAFRNGINEIGSKKITKALDYSVGIDELLKLNVLKYLLNGNRSVVIRLFGTELKLKVYISVSAENKEAVEEKIVDSLRGFFQ